MPHATRVKIIGAIVTHTRLIAAGCAAAVLSAYLPETPSATVNWLISLSSAWGMHAGIFLLLWAGLDAASLSKRWGRQSAALLLGFIGLLPFLSGLASRAPSDATPRWTVAAWNLHVDNDRLNAGLAWLQQDPADLVVLSEASAKTKDMVGQRFGTCFWNQRDDAFGMLVCSPHELQGQWVTIEGWTVGWQGLLRKGPETVAVWAVHPPPPLTAEMDAANRALWQRIAKEKATSALVLGDFNATPSSAGLKVLKNWHWAGSRAPTWMAPLGLALDHIVSQGLCAKEFVVSPAVDSDHRGVKAVLGACS